MRPKSTIYTPKRDDKHPRHFHMGVPTPRGVFCKQRTITRHLYLRSERLEMWVVGRVEKLAEKRRERPNLVPRVFSLFNMAAAQEKTQPRPQGLLAFQHGGGSGEDPTSSPGSSRFSIWRRLRRRPNLVPSVFSLFNMAAAREKTLAHSRSRDQNLQRRWSFIQNGGYGEKSEKIWVRDMAEVKINKMEEKAVLQFKGKKRGKKDKFCM